jgi:hypothetical protein
MAKTYGTVITFTAGSVLTAAQLNVAGTAVNNLVLPASARVVRTSNLTSYTTGAAITWSSAAWDTDGMFSAGSPTILTVNTAGLYVVTFTGAGEASPTLTRVLAAIMKNGTTVAFQESYGNSTGNTGYFSMSAVLSVAVSDTIGANVGFTGGSAYIVDGNASEAATQTRLTATWIGRTS